MGWRVLDTRRAGGAAQTLVSGTFWHALRRARLGSRAGLSPRVANATACRRPPGTARPGGHRSNSPRWRNLAPDAPLPATTVPATSASAERRPSRSGRSTKAEPETTHGRRTQPRLTDITETCLGERRDGVDGGTVLRLQPTPSVARPQGSRERYRWPNPRRGLSSSPIDRYVVGWIPPR